ncbi:MAG: hypothetical protein LBE91_20735 [Tannerella sp.]|jgi:hypothetical protein|nr:hypothetical protein [Tannerella sp.]
MIFPLSHVVAKFLLDGKEYGVETFKIDFNQPTDFKGQPQHEVRGGQMMVTIMQLADNSLYAWAKTATMLKSGAILFQTDLGMTVLRIEFEKGYCISLATDIDAKTGTKTSLLISPEIVKLNGEAHDNFWPK